MALWFGRHAGLPADGGYFYLCPECFAQRIEPHLEEVLNRLVEQHPFLHRLRVDHETPRPVPPRQAGALPIAHELPSAPPPGEQPGAPQLPNQPPDAAA